MLNTKFEQHKYVKYKFTGTKKPKYCSIFGLFLKCLAYKAMNLSWPQQQGQLELLEQPQQLELQ